MKKFKTSRLARAAQLGLTVAKASRHFVEDAKKIAQKANVQDILVSTQKLAAVKELVESMGEMKGAVMKIGQMISITDDLALPPEISAIFKKLQKDAPPMDNRQITNVFKREFGKRPEEIFSDFDRKAIAAASIGQVHKAKISNNIEVAVKVQYPKIAQTIKSDVKNIESLKKGLNVIFKDMPKIDHIIEEAKNALIEECDYLREAKQQIEYKDLNSEFDFLKIPIVYPKYSSKAILTTELCHGDHFDESLRYGQEIRDLLCLQLFTMHIKNFFQKGLLHVDPQEGNYLFDQSKIILLDFGAVKKFDQNFIYSYALLTYAVRVDNIEIFNKAAINLGILRKETLHELSTPYYKLSKKFYLPFLSEDKSKIPLFNFMQEFQETIKTIKGKTAPHKDFLMLDRANLGLYSKLKRWQGEVLWLDIIKQYQIPVEEEAYKLYQQGRL